MSTATTIAATYDDLQLFALLADETRLKVMHLLAGGERHVGAICDHLGQSQPAVSHHLAMMRVAGLVEYRKSGKQNIYRVVPGRIRPLAALLAGLAGKKVGK